MPVKVKKCAKCGQKKPIEQFGKHSDSSDGYQSYCKTCKNGLHKQARHVNIGFRIKHHFASRIAKQLGPNLPENAVKDLESLLGYKFWELKRALDDDIRAREGISIREALNRNYHIDHIKPLSSFGVTEVKTPEGLQKFRECWAISNLKLIPAAENLAKGAKYAE